MLCLAQTASPERNILLPHKVNFNERSYYCIWLLFLFRSHGTSVLTRHSAQLIAPRLQTLSVNVDVNLMWAVLWLLFSRCITSRTHTAAWSQRTSHLIYSQAFPNPRSTSAMERFWLWSTTRVKPLPKRYCSYRTRPPVTPDSHHPSSHSSHVWWGRRINNLLDVFI